MARTKYEVFKRPKANRKGCKMKRSDIRKALTGQGHDALLVEKALKKAERWMRAAYGEVNWDELQRDTGDAVGAVTGYMVECEKNPEGIKTFNRGYL